MAPGTTSASSANSPPASALAAAVLGNIALAFGPWFVRLADVGPVASAFWRMALAAPVLVIAMIVLRQTPRRLPRAVWIALIAGGTLFAADLAAWHLGILQTKLANATLFGNVTSLLFPLYGFLIARAWPNRWQAAALLLAAVGTGVMMGRSYEASPVNLAGDLLSLLAGVFYTFYFIAMSRARDTLAPLPVLALSTVASILPLGLAVPAFGEGFVAANWWPLIGLAVVSQLIGQGLMIYALGHLQPVVIGIALLLQPIVTGAIGWFAYDETLGPIDLMGAAMVATAMVLVRRTPRTVPIPQQLEPPGVQEDKLPR